MPHTEGLQKVDRLTTGRRHVRAGSVSVTELITKQAARPESPPPVQADTETTVTIDRTVDVPVEPEAGPTSHRRATTRGAQLAKITSLGVATIVLCGAVGIASTIAHRRQDDAEATDHPAEQINGEQALLPGQLDRTLTPRGAAAATPPRPAPATRTTHHAAPPAPRTARTATTTAPDSPAVAAPRSDLGRRPRVLRAPAQRPRRSRSTSSRRTCSTPRWASSSSPGRSSAPSTC